MKERKNELNEKRRKLAKVGLALLTGGGLLTLLKKDAKGCGSCLPGCSPSCVDCQNGSSNIKPTN